MSAASAIRELRTYVAAVTRHTRPAFVRDFADTLAHIDAARLVMRAVLAGDPDAREMAEAWLREGEE